MSSFTKEDKKKIKRKQINNQLHKKLCIVNK